jgi:nitric oxide reductase large subunit
MTGPNLWLLIMMFVFVVWVGLLLASKFGKPYQRLLNDKQAKTSLYVVIAIGVVSFFTIILFYP